MSGTNKKSLPLDEIPSGGGSEHGKKVEETCPLQDLTTGVSRSVEFTLEPNEEQRDTAELLEEIKAAAGPDDEDFVPRILDFTANTYALASPLLAENPAAAQTPDDAETQAAIASLADSLLAMLEEKLPNVSEQLRNGRAALGKLIRTDGKQQSVKRPGKRGFFRPALAAGLLSLASVHATSFDAEARPQSSAHKLSEPDYGPDGSRLADQPPTTAGQVTEWFEGTWTKLTGGHGKGTSGESSRPFKLPVIPTALALIWALALATDKFKWDDWAVIGGSTAALATKLTGSAIHSFFPDWVPSPLEAFLGPTWWWLLEEVWVTTSLIYLSKGPLKDRKGLHYILGAAIWVALGYMNR